MKPIVLEMVKLCAQGEDFALATVVTRNGSAPRSTGAKMLVRSDGSSVGTVGGGMLEAQVLQLAVQMVSERRAVIQSFQFNGVAAAEMDAICGGQVEVLVEFIAAGNPHTKDVVQELEMAVKSHRRAWLVTAFQAVERKTTHALVLPDGSTRGDLPEGLSAGTVLSAKLPALLQVGPLQVMIEPIDTAGSVFIFGAGHVSRSLAGFTKTVGFYTVVLDDRAEFANRERFPDSDEVLVLESFTDCLAALPIDESSFIVIVTRGHVNDLVVLAQALKTRAGYIGMIGSRRKCEMIFQELRRSGFGEADLRRVNAPIGLPIRAETPEEIGISITAEMIAARAKLND